MDEFPDEEITQQYAELRMIEKDTPEKMLEFYQEVIKPLDRIYIEIFKDDFYDFKENNDFSERGFNTIMEVQKKSITAVHNMNEEYIFVDRTLLGYYAMFEQMEAKIDTRFAQKIVRY
jgi:phage head maturation protease